MRVRKRHEAYHAAPRLRVLRCQSGKAAAARFAQRGFERLERLQDGNDLCMHAERVRFFLRVLERSLRSVRSWQHHAVHVFGPHRVNAHACHKRRIHAARKAQHHIRKARLPRKRPQRVRACLVSFPCRHGGSFPVLAAPRALVLPAARPACPLLRQTARL